MAALAASPSQSLQYVFSASGEFLVSDSSLHQGSASGDVEVRDVVMHPNAAAVIEAIVADSVNRVQESLRVRGTYDDVFTTYALNDQGMNAVHVAAANGAFAVIEWCIGLGCANLDATVPGTGWSAMHYAALNGHDTICALLKHKDANTDLLDSYGDTPCDVAMAAGNTAVVDVLGGNFAMREARRRIEEERDRLLDEARAYEEERLQQKRAAEEAAEKKRLAEQRKRERVRRNRELRARLEGERLALIQKWLLQRQGLERDCWMDLEWLFASQLLMSNDLMSAEIKCLALVNERAEKERLEAEALAALEEQQAAASKKKKGKAPGGKKAVGAKAASPEPMAVSRGVTPGVSPGVTPSAAARHGAMDAKNPAAADGSPSPPPDEQLSPEELFERELANDPDLQLPVIQGVVTKEKKKELLTAKRRIERIKRERREARRAAIEAYEQRCEAECNEVSDEEAMMRSLLEVDWLLGMAHIEQSDMFNDRRHPGEFIYHSTEPRCRCGLPSCVLGTCSWTCCGSSEFDEVGCAIVDDTSKPPYHPGSFDFHMEGCTCSRAKVVVGTTREVVKTLVDLKTAPHRFTDVRDSDEDDGGLHESSDEEPDAMMGGEEKFGASRLAAVAARSTNDGGGGGASSSQRKKSTAPVKFCNPGGTVWSCCGASEHDSDGCIMWPRFLHVESVLALPRFVEAQAFAQQTLAPAQLRKGMRQSVALSGGGSAVVDASLAKYCRVEICGEHGMDVSHQLVEPMATTTSACTVVGKLSATDAAAMRCTGPLDGRQIFAFEVQIRRCAVPQTPAEQRLVVGFALGDAYIGPGVCLGGSVGLGWWAHSTQVRGLGCTLDVSEPYAEGDIICLALDNLNQQLYCFKNRRLLGTCAFRAPAPLNPAVTLVAGSRIAVDDTMSRQTVTYVDDYALNRAEGDRNQRLFGSSDVYKSRFRDKFELQRRRELKERGGEVDESSDDEARINFDV